MLLTTFLISSCKTGIICKEINKAKIRPLVNCDLSLQFKRCRCRCVDYNTITKVDDKFCGENFVSKDYPIDTCEGLSGSFIEDWAKEIKPKVNRLNRVKRAYCK